MHCDARSAREKTVARGKVSSATRMQNCVRTSRGNSLAGWGGITLASGTSTIFGQSAPSALPLMQTRHLENVGHSPTYARCGASTTSRKMRLGFTCCRGGPPARTRTWIVPFRRRMPLSIRPRVDGARRRDRTCALPVRNRVLSSTELGVLEPALGIEPKSSPYHGVALPLSYVGNWSRWRDLNPQPLGPKPSALPD